MSAPSCHLPAHVPLAIQTRGEHVESIHYGSAIVIDAQGDTLHRIGDTTGYYFARSTLKPLFAVGILRAGLDLDARQLALTAASHSGSPRHQQVALSILRDAGLGEDTLGNLADLPYGATEKTHHLASGGSSNRLAQNCSGKHAALLALCVLRGWDTATYLQPGHPVSNLLHGTIEELTGETPAHTSIDGCGTPVYALTLGGLARAFSRLATAPPTTPEYRVALAMRTHPELVAGEDRDTTTFMRTVPGSIAKDGFEGVQVASLADGTAIAVKIADGGDRARMPVTAALLHDHLPVANRHHLSDLLSSPVTAGAEGTTVGSLRAL